MRFRAERGASKYGRVQQLTTFENKLAFVRYPAWSPKGDQIVFERNDLVANIYVGELR